MDIYETDDKIKSDQLITLLMNWYNINQRELVWRKTQEPYAIWVSEIMAQQTRITAVLPYYKRFMAQFPSIHVLANAPIDDVLKSWEGLGYYSRAHNLLKSAKIVVEDYNGHFPSDVRLLKKLPGIGEYTAGALASICFNKPEPAVDGNVQREFARIYNNSLDVALPDSKKLLTAFIKNLMPNEQPGIFNQALMELGALVCVPKNPLCYQCPVNALCKAYALNKQNQLPVKSPKKAVNQVNFTILLIINNQDEVLLRQRDEKLLNGLWEFYMVEQALDINEAKIHLQKLGFIVENIIPLGKATHIFTHMKWNMTGYQCQVAEVVQLDKYEVVAVEDMQKLAMPTAIQYYRDWLDGKNAVQISLENI